MIDVLVPDLIHPQLIGKEIQDHQMIDMIQGAQIDVHHLVRMIEIAVQVTINFFNRKKNIFENYFFLFDFKFSFD